VHTRGNTRALYEIANFFKREQSEQESNKVAVIFVTFNDFSPVLEWEQADPRAALCRRIAFAAMKGRDYDHSLNQYKVFATAQGPHEEIVNWLKSTRCLFLIDELNLLEALSENRKEAARKCLIC
jgi:alkyl hydroperoxide reductase subunit AhpC